MSAEGTVAARTVVHLLRHGEVHNPDGILYGRIAGYRLSERGERMAAAVAADLGTRDVAAMVCSPLERAQQTARPLADALGLEVRTDDRLVESTNVFEGVAVAARTLRRQPRYWRHLWNPFLPSWGEAYSTVADRVLAAVADARDSARGREVVCVSHQLPIWSARCRAEGRRLWHDPRTRRCALASVTSFHYDGDVLVGVGYREPAAGV